MTGVVYVGMVVSISVVDGGDVSIVSGGFTTVEDSGGKQYPYCGWQLSLKQ